MNLSLTSPATWSLNDKGLYRYVRIQADPHTETLQSHSQRIPPTKDTLLLGYHWCYHGESSCKKSLQGCEKIMCAFVLVK
ncbi:hypothetical protein DPMN_009375 [Dreissena polymorpha]|uniref:Uncharacterized protein n=1 Tax=Dreissena polymorpha TaxID=45954 RepID=A0A9D4MWS9_DREPO|nr:hypothetical protein DPMN_009375 [Dreissena polymorpha]